MTKEVQGLEALHEESAEVREEVKETVDPGSLEGKPKEEKKPEPPPDHPRFQKVYGKMKEFERQLNEKDAQHTRDIELLRQHNEQLIAAVRAGQSRPETKDVAEEINAKIRELKSAKVQAKKDLDWDREAMLEDQIDDLKEKLSDRKILSRTERAKQETERSAGVKQVSQVLIDFQESTPWFNENSDAYDPLMEGAAIALDNKLLRDPKWAKRPMIERLNEVRKRVEERFGVTKAPKIPTVEGAGGSRQAGVTKTNLSDDQKRVARLMFRDMDTDKAEKLYAEQLRIIDKGEK